MEDHSQALDYIEVEFRNGRLGYYQNKNNLTLQPDDLIIAEVGAERISLRSYTWRYPFPDSLATG